LKKYLSEKDALHAGRTPDYTADALTILILCGKLLTTKKRMLDAGELSIRSYTDYGAVCQRLIKAFGKGRLVSDLRPDDFEKLRASMAKKWGPVRLGNEINRTRKRLRRRFTEPAGNHNPRNCRPHQETTDITAQKLTKPRTTSTDLSRERCSPLSFREGT
jgi:hypothetical protein